jgi:hypothetical protein
LRRNAMSMSVTAMVCLCRYQQTRNTWLRTERHHVNNAVQ